MQNTKEEKDSESKAAAPSVEDVILFPAKKPEPLKSPDDVLNEWKEVKNREGLLSFIKNRKRQSHDPDPENIRYFPDIVTYTIGGFTPWSTFNNYLRTNVENYSTLHPLVIQKNAEQLNDEWYGLLEKSVRFNKYKDKPIEDFLKVLASQDKERMQFLQYVISQGLFRVIDYLMQKKISLNSWVENYSSNESLKIIGRPESFFGQGNHSCTHTVLDKEFTASPLKTEMILYLMKSGVEVSANHFTLLIIPGVFRILNNNKQHSGSRLMAAGELLVIAFKNGMVEKMEDLAKIMQAASHIKNSSIKQIEAFFLIKQLESILPYSWNWLADQRDTPLIQAAIARLKLIVALPKIDAGNINLLEQIKNTLAVKSSQGTDPGKLFVCLQNLQEKGLIVLQADSGQVDFDAKAKPPLIRQDVTLGVDEKKRSLLSSASVITKVGQFKAPSMQPPKCFSSIQPSIELGKDNALICVALSSMPDQSTQLLIETITGDGAWHCRVYCLAERLDGMLHHTSQEILDKEKLLDLSGYVITAQQITLADSVALQHYLEVEQDTPVSIKYLNSEGAIGWKVWYDATLAKVAPINIQQELSIRYI
jgi:hypothetical protein